MAPQSVRAYAAEMITNLSIDRFKSIRSLSIPCRKINLFIGAPDTGKTNILDALAFGSQLGWGLPVGSLLRLRPEIGFDPLFHRQFFDQPFQIRLLLDGSPGRCSIDAKITGQDHRLTVATESQPHIEIVFNTAPRVDRFQFLRSYTYSSSEAWQYVTPTDIVLPPHGGNLLYIARHNVRVYDFLKETVASLNWKLRFDQTHKVFRLSEVRGDEILDYNLDLLSDSLKRLFFYGAIVLSSKNAVVVLDEPDVFAFPPYPKLLAEMIARDDQGNQYFVTTHNPYFLSTLAEKANTDQLALFVCHRDDDGATAAKLLRPEQVSRVIEMGASVFFNLDDFLE